MTSTSVTSSALDPNIARSTTDATGGVYSATQGAPKTSSTALGKDAFLKLLVAQMKYQDPMNPSSNTDFIAQTAQFTVVEKLQEMSEANAKLLASQNQLTASTFIGRDVAWTVKDEHGLDVTKSGTVTGISFTADGPTLRVGKEDIALSAITAVAPVIDNSTTTGTTAGTPSDGSTAPPTDASSGTTGNLSGTATA
jgi:flagellar basal-body rod modification protein FlgD